MRAASIPQRDRWFETTSLQRRVACEPSYRTEAGKDGWSRPMQTQPMWCASRACGIENTVRQPAFDDLVTWMRTAPSQPATMCSATRRSVDTTAASEGSAAIGPCFVSEPDPKAYVAWLSTSH